VVVLDDPAADPGAGRSGAVCIAEQAWAPGLGWYTQRTVSVTEDQLDGLIARLQRARAGLGPARRGKILPFRPRPLKSDLKSELKSAPGTSSPE
jgi:hypothetical protein